MQDVYKTAIDRRSVLRGIGMACTVATLPLEAYASAPLTVGLIRNPVSGLIALSDQKGWLKENGTTFQSVLFSGAAGPKVLQAMGGGSIGIGSVSVTAALLALATGAVPLKIISIATDPAPLFALLSSPDIDSVQKLAGKKVATTAGTGLQYFLVRSLEKYGMTLKDVVFENMAALDAQSAFLAGRIDALVPSLNGRFYIHSVRKDVRDLFVFDDFAKPPKPTNFVDQDVFVATDAALSGQADQIKGFLKAYHDEAVAYLHDPATQADAIAQITKYVNTQQKSPTDDKIMRDLLLKSGFPTRAESRKMLQDAQFRQGLEDQIKFFMESGKMSKAPDLSKAIDASLL